MVRMRDLGLDSQRAVANCDHSLDLKGNVHLGAYMEQKRFSFQQWTINRGRDQVPGQVQFRGVYDG